MKYCLRDLGHILRLNIFSNKKNPVSILDTKEKKRKENHIKTTTPFFTCVHKMKVKECMTGVVDEDTSNSTGIRTFP